MSRRLFSPKSVLLIFLCGALLGLSPSSIVNAAEKNTSSFDQPAQCSAFLLKNQDYFHALIKMIDEAKSEIILSFFLFKAGVHKNSDPDRVAAHLAKSAQKGLKVIVILEHSGGRDPGLDAENRQTKQLLEEKGVEVYLDSPRKTTHTKLVIVDRRLILLGSHNLTQAALKHNNEISLVMDRPDLANEARNYLLQIIKDAR